MARTFFVEVKMHDDADFCAFCITPLLDWGKSEVDEATKDGRFFLTPFRALTLQIACSWMEGQTYRAAGNLEVVLVLVETSEAWAINQSIDRSINIHCIGEIG